MFYIKKRLFTILGSLVLLTNIAYTKMDSSFLFNKEQSIIHINEILKKKQFALQKIQKSHTLEYVSLFDEIAELSISKNKLLLEMDKVDAIDTDKTCDLALKYGEIEFIKTEYYKTPFHDEVAKTLENIAALFEQCHPPMAGKYLNSVLQIKENIYGKESAEAAKIHDALGNYYRIYMADFKESIKQYKKAKSIREKLYGIKDSRVTENYERLAVSLYYHGDKTGKSEKLLHKAIDIRRNNPFSKEYPLYVAYMDLGIYYSMKDEYTKSIEYLQKALKSFEGKVNSNYIVIISELSQIYLNQDNLRNAQKYGEEAYRVSKEFYRSNEHYQVLENYNRLSEINERMNQEKAK
jgi:tetratricopeptide (TPR) repeat protein